MPICAVWLLCQNITGDSELTSVTPAQCLAASDSTVSSCVTEQLQPTTAISAPCSKTSAAPSATHSSGSCAIQPASSSCGIERRPYVTGRKYTLRRDNGLTYEAIWDGKYMVAVMLDPASTSSVKSSSAGVAVYVYWLWVH